MEQTNNGGDRPKEAQKESSYNIKVDGKYNYLSSTAPSKTLTITMGPKTKRKKQHLQTPRWKQSKNDY